MRRRLLNIRPLNWLAADPWRIATPWTCGWSYRAIYQHMRAGSRNPFTGRVYAEPAGRLRSLWLTVTFPHVHADYE